jgi:hypothetical protein
MVELGQRRDEFLKGRVVMSIAHDALSIAAAFETFTGSRPTITSEAPSARAWRAIAKPMPELPPITTTFLCSSSISDLSSLSNDARYRSLQARLLMQ